MRSCAVIIPVLNPTENLVVYVKTLLAKGADQTIVVNDGSKEELTYIFTELSIIEGCTVLHHEKNKGKGRALKTAFNYFQKHYKDLDGVITADADGQHSVEDVFKVAKALKNSNGGLVLGVRDFSKSNVPFRSYIGNRTTSFIFHLLYGYKLEDTQTGLRGIPKKELPWIMDIKGERYEYEINMLIYAKKMNVQISEIPIQTLYFDNNASSHYNPFVDSMKIFIKLISGFVHYSYSTIVSGAIDIGSFILLASLILNDLPLEARIFFATFVSRMLSSSCNFYMNRKFVFKGVNKLIPAIIKYYILCFGLIYASYILVTTANLYLSVNVILAKIFTDTLLGIVSYEFQLHWVFKGNKKELIQSSVGENHEG